MSEYYDNELEDRYFNVFSSDSSSHCSDTAPTETTSLNGNFELGPAALFDNGPIGLQPTPTVDPKAIQYSELRTADPLGAVGGWAPFSPPTEQYHHSQSTAEAPFELSRGWQYTTPTDAPPYHPGSRAWEEQMRAAGQAAAEGSAAIAQAGASLFQSMVVPQFHDGPVLDEIEAQRPEAAPYAPLTPPSSDGSLSPARMLIERSIPMRQVASVQHFVCCIKCRKGFTRLGSLHRHINDQHSGESLPSVSYRCNICAHEESRLDKMQLHVQVRHQSKYQSEPWTEKTGPSQREKRQRAPNGTRTPKKKKGKRDE